MDNIIIGIDPGYDRIGWAVAKKKKQQTQLLAYGCIITDRKQKLWDRYLQIEKELEEIIEQFHPNLAVVEELFFSKNTTTALKVAEARGVILNTLAKEKIEITEINPTQAKSALTGNSKANKKEMKMMVERLLNKKLHGIDDALDAVGFVLI